MVTKAAPNSAANTVGGLHRVNWDNPFTGGRPLKNHPMPGVRVRQHSGPFCF